MKLLGCGIGICLERLDDFKCVMFEDFSYFICLLYLSFNLIIRFSKRYNGFIRYFEFIFFLNIISFNRRILFY